MDINKISSHLSSQLNETKSTEQGEKSSAVSSSKKEDTVFTDKVSLKEQSKLKNEKIFAKIELAKLEQSSFEKLKSMKAKLTEYDIAKSEAPENVNNTDIGKMLNDPDVWEEIAEKILR